MHRPIDPAAAGSQPPVMDMTADVSGGGRLQPLPGGVRLLGGSPSRINPFVLRRVASFGELTSLAISGVASVEITALPLDSLLAPTCAFAAAAILVAFAWLTQRDAGTLQKFIHQSRSARLGEIVPATIVLFFATLAIAWATFPADAATRFAAFARWLVVWGGLTLGIMTAGRLTLAALLRGWLSQGRLTLRIAVVGYGVLSQRLIRWLDEFSAGIVDIVGIFDDRAPGRLPQSALTGLLRGTIDDLVEFAKEQEIDRVIVALPHSADERILAILRRLKQIPADIGLAPDMAGFAAAPDRNGEFGGLPLVNVYGHPLRSSQRLVKDCGDRLLAGLALLVLLPGLLAIVIAIKLDSKGPVFFRQRRYGFGGRVINVLKFRSMYAERADYDARQQTRRDDPRVTRVGRLLRRMSADELPQLLNVLHGDMSLVGPRPLATQMRVEERLNHDIVSDYALRHRVKPGITGWAQVNGYRGAVNDAEALRARVACDLSYIENWSLWFDLRILLMTARTTLGGENAY
jgi:Undecaprenyl-phosphate glucose phosphotransferase